MRLLHFIDERISTADNDILSYLPSLLHTLCDNMESMALVPKNSYNFFLGLGVDVQTYGTSYISSLRNGIIFRRILEDFNPDMVHIHGCVSYIGARFMRKCVRENIPVVITTGKIFEPWNIRNSYFTCGLPRLMRYQLEMLKKACAIHCLNAQERDNLLSLCHNSFKKTVKPINKNISVISNFNTVPNYDIIKMAFDMETLYLKVADSNPFMMLSKDELRCEDLLLYAGISSELPEFYLSEADKTALSLLTDISKRYLLIHAYDEDVSNLVISGASKLHIHIPNLEVNTFERFESIYKQTVLVRRDESKLKQCIDSDATLSSESVKNVCFAIMAVWQKYKNNKLSRKDFVELYKVLRFTDFDEVLLLQSLRRMRFMNRAARLLNVLANRYMLTEGFMFTVPKDDYLTKKIKRKLCKIGTQ